MDTRLNFKNTERWILGVSFFLLFLVSQGFCVWSVLDAPARFVVDMDTPDKPSKIGTVKICFPDPKWNEMPINVFSEANVAVGSSVLWKADGEPTTIMFDTSSGSKRYYIYVGLSPSGVPKSSWNPQAGVVLETREGDGKPVYNLDQMKQAWDRSTTVYGKSISDMIYTGGHIHGPQGNVLSRYQGWFEATADAKYLFATVSTDASFLLVDGKPVVEWPGHHHFHHGRWGKFQAGVNLTRGIHSVEYFNAYHSMRDTWPLLCVASVKAGDQSPWVILMANSNFFLPIGKAHVGQYELQPPELLAMTATPNSPPKAKAPPLAFEWEPVAQSIPTWEPNDVGFVSMQLRTYPTAGKGSYKWAFDDKTAGDGNKLEHLFFRPGLRTVRVSMNDGNVSVGELSLPVWVHPNWTQMVYKRPEINPKHLELALAKSADMNASDFGSLVGLLATFEDADMLYKLFPTLHNKAKDLSEADLAFILKVSALFANGDVRHYNEAMQLLQDVINRASANAATLQGKGLASRARVALGRIILKNTDRRNEVQALVDGIEVSALADDEKKSLGVLKADLVLANGDATTAKQQYAALTGEQTGADARSSIRRTAKVDQANAFFRNKDYDSADRLLDEIEAAAPVEKISADFILIKLKLLKERGDNDAAYYYAKRMLPLVSSGGFRSEMLFVVTDLAYSRGENDLAAKSLKELIAKYPYSEAAAQAKIKWHQASEVIK